MRLELIVNHALFASHSLAGNDHPHSHLWKIELGLTGAPVQGKIIDLPTVEGAIKESLQIFDNVYLNDCMELDSESRSFPTCETLCMAWAKRLDARVFDRFRETANPTLRLLRIRVTLCEPDGTVFGAAELTL